MRNGVFPRGAPPTKISAPFGSLVTLSVAFRNANIFHAVSPRLISLVSRNSHSPRRAVTSYLPVGKSASFVGVTPSREISPSSDRIAHGRPDSLASISSPPLLRVIRNNGGALDRRSLKSIVVSI